MISKKANEEFWKSVTVPIDKKITIKLNGDTMVIKKKNEENNQQKEPKQL